jgi:hypothetical protein
VRSTFDEGDGISGLVALILAASTLVMLALA